MSVTQDSTEAGRIARANEILRSPVGSEVHGTALPGVSDHDEMGVFIEPPDLVAGLMPGMDHVVHRSQPEGARSGPGDTDLIIYSLRRYLRLAIKGNPTVLIPLFAPEPDLLVRTGLGDELRALAPAVLSQQAVHRFLGYLSAQRDRLVGKRLGGPKRPELVQRHGYDVKYAAHALRLAHQGLQIARDGWFALPMPEQARERVLRVRRGEAGPLVEVLAEIATVEAAVVETLHSGRSPLPVEPDVAQVSAWSVSAHRRHWGWR